MIRSYSDSKYRSGGLIAALSVAWLAASGIVWGQSSWPGYPANTAINVTSGGYVGIGTPSSAPFTFTALSTLAAYEGSNTYVALGEPASGSAYPTTYGGIWYDGISNTFQIEALSGGVAWRDIVLNGQGGGNVGVGTAHPASNNGGVGRIVDIHAAGATNSVLVLENGGTSGSNTGAILEARNSAVASGDPRLGQLNWTRNNDVTTGKMSTFFQLYVNNDGTLVSAMNVAANGYVGIGTTAPAHLLHVNGTIGAKEVIVSSTGADYVFDPDYQLTPLSSVVDYVRANRHLPDIPSAADAQANGMSVGEMQTKLLAKIEELTLYLAESEQKMAQSDRKIRQLEAEIKEMKEARVR